MENTDKTENLPLFEIDPEWREEWQDMPEFVQERQEPFKTITVRFQSQADLDAFAQLIGQKLTRKTKSIWYPFRSHWGHRQRVVYRDEP